LPPRQRGGSLPENIQSFRGIIMSGIILFVILACLYFVPSIVARAREHHNYGAIVALNIFLGWTFIGWVASLVWALTSTKAAAS
jgi:hypothetical protein